MANLSDRLKALEQRVISAIGATPAIVQIIHGARTIEQQTEYENAVLDGVDVIAISLINCRKDSPPWQS